MGFQVHLVLVEEEEHLEILARLEIRDDRVGFFKNVSTSKNAYFLVYT